MAADAAPPGLPPGARPTETFSWSAFSSSILFMMSSHVSELHASATAIAESRSDERASCSLICTLTCFRDTDLRLNLDGDLNDLVFCLTRLGDFVGVMTSRVDGVGEGSTWSAPGLLEPELARLKENDRFEPVDCSSSEDASCELVFRRACAAWESPRTRRLNISGGG